MFFEYKTYWTDSYANKYFARMVINFFSNCDYVAIDFAFLSYITITLRIYYTIANFSNVVHTRYTRCCLYILCYGDTIYNTIITFLKYNLAH